MTFYLVISKKVDFERRMYERLSDLAPALIDMARKRQKCKPLVHKLDQRREALTELDKLEESQRNFACAAFPLILNEDPDYIFCKTEMPNVQTPIVVGIDTDDVDTISPCAVRLQGTTVYRCQDGDPSSTLPIIMAAYFTFGFNYPPQLKKTLTFCERYLLDIKETEAPVSVTRLHQALTRNN